MSEQEMGRGVPITRVFDDMVCLVDEREVSPLDYNDARHEPARARITSRSLWARDRFIADFTRLGIKVDAIDADTMAYHHEMARAEMEHK